MGGLLCVSHGMLCLRLLVCDCVRCGVYVMVSRSLCIVSMYDVVRRYCCVGG